ncbi:hypothetical protein D3C80_1765190 [compost metagenome]
MLRLLNSKAAAQVNYRNNYAAQINYPFNEGIRFGHPGNRHHTFDRLDLIHFNAVFFRSKLKHNYFNIFSHGMNLPVLS